MQKQAKLFANEVNLNLNWSSFKDVCLLELETLIQLLIKNKYYFMQLSLKQV